MIIFLYGADTYRSRRKLTEIIKHYKKIHKSGLNLKYFEGSSPAGGLNYQNFKDEFYSISMFHEKKLIVLEDVTLVADFKNNFLKDIKRFADSENIIIFYEKGKTPVDIFFNSLKKYGKSQEFKLLEGWQLKNWVKKELENFRAKIDEEAVNKLINFIGDDLWQMENEIKKLVCYKKGKVIRERDVEVLIKPKIETDIFETINAIASKNKKRALQLLKRHLEKGDSPLYLLSMINFQFRNLLIIKDLIKKNLSPYTSKSIHPYVVKKSLILSKKFEISELKKIYQKIFQIDFDIKTGKIIPETALDLFIAEI